MPTHDICLADVFSDLKSCITALFMADPHFCSPVRCTFSQYVPSNSTSFVLQDAYLPQRLVDKLMYMYNYIEMARVTGVPMSFLLTRGQSIKVFSQILRKARQRNLLVPFVKVNMQLCTFLSCSSLVIFAARHGHTPSLGVKYFHWMIASNTKFHICSPYSELVGSDLFDA